MQDYRKLDVWTKSHELALDVHGIRPIRRHGPHVPADEGGAACAEADGEVLAAVRQAALRVPVLLVVGCEAETAPEFALAMRDAATAVDELAYRLRFLRDAGVLEAVPYAKLEARANQLRAMLGALHRTVRLKLGAEVRPGAAQAAAQAATQAAVARARRAVQDDGSSRTRSRPRATS